MNARTRRLRGDHRRATREAAEMSCLICEKPGCVPAHWPTHRGMGGGKAGWRREEWIPLCCAHHDLVDGRLGVSATIEAERRLAIAVIKLKLARPR